MPTLIVGNRQRLAETRFDAVVMVGGMCAGKSPIGRAVATELSSRAAVVRRVSTRPPRIRDDEVTIVSWDEFEQQANAGLSALSWVRPVAQGEPIGYGCLAAPPGVVPIFMAGHGVYSNRASVRPIDALSRALLFGVLATADGQAPTTVTPISRPHGFG